jgi:hypothetical protein
VGVSSRAANGNKKGGTVIYNLETLDSLIEFNKKFAHAYYKEHGTLRPMIIGYTPDNSKRVVILGTFENNQEKEYWLQTACIVFALHDVDKYVIMHEAWFVSGGEKEAYKKYESLEQHPDRKEAVCIMAVNRLGAKLTVSEILPDRSISSENNNNHTGEAEGRFSELLPPRKITAAEKKELQKIVSIFMKTGIITEELLNGNGGNGKLDS